VDPAAPEREIAGAAQCPSLIKETEMSDLLGQAMKTRVLAAPLTATESARAAGELSQLSGTQVYPRSITALEETILFLCRRGENKLLGILSEGGPLKNRFAGSASTVVRDGRSLQLKLCKTTAENAS